MLALFDPKGLNTYYDMAPRTLPPQQIMVRRLVEQDDHTISFVFYDQLMSQLRSTDAASICAPAAEVLKTLDALETTLRIHREEMPKFYRVRWGSERDHRDDLGMGVYVFLQGERYSIQGGWGGCIARGRENLDLSEQQQVSAEVQAEPGQIRRVAGMVKIIRHTIDEYYGPTIERLKQVCHTSPTGWVYSHVG